MPSVEKPDRSLLTGAVDEIISKKRRQKHESSGATDAYDPGFLNILEFIDRFKLLPNGLYPVQRFILKMYYNIPLDDSLPSSPGDRIRIGKSFRKAGTVEVTEVEYLKYLFDNGRSNIAVQDFKPRRELILVLGRRSGKSMMSSIISAYELYKLIARGMPQAYYGMLPSAEIRVLCIANDKEQAEIVYGEIQNHVQHVDYFSSAVVKQTQSLMKFRTQGDAQRFKKDPNKGTISATFKSSIARGIRGRGCMACILDELAFFVDDGKSSAEQVYRAVNPSLKQFSPKDPKNRRQSIGPSDGRMICISSPDAKDGLFYKLYELSKTGSVASSQMLMIQAPTWEVNPTVDEADYEVERAKDPRGFETEYGAQFSDRVRGWIQNAQDLLDCCLPNLRPLVRGAPREPFFAGGDLAISGDGTCISLSHIVDGRIQLGYHETWCAGVPWEESNPHLQAPSTSYASTLASQKRLDVDEIVEWFYSLSRRFYILSGLLDQAFGVIFEQKLHKKGLTQFECRRFSTSDSSDAYQNAQMLMFMRQLGIYDYPVPEQGEDSILTTARHSPHISEMLELQAASGGKNVIIVTKPNIPGKKDDFSDSLVRSLSLASNYVKENPSVLELSKLSSSSVLPRRQVPPSPYSQQRMRARMHGPPPKERRIPASMRRR
jgi:hypothetical protein